MSSQLRMAKQTAIIQAAAYNASVRPIRIANATRVREAKLAGREARKEARFAKLEEQRQLERQRQAESQEFLMKARRWTDSTGKHELMAVLVYASSWGVTLLKQDGTGVHVPMHRLSRNDQQYVDYHVLPALNGKGETLTTGK
ncbi:MAG: hypothetical protein MI861_04460 [Pirellulales bacterium]|nr:hypothetical protein [Pirellulales bacterium]